jgi:hypothetical protein
MLPSAGISPRPADWWALAFPSHPRRFRKATRGSCEDEDAPQAGSFPVALPFNDSDVLRRQAGSGKLPRDQKFRLAKHRMSPRKLPRNLRLRALIDTQETSPKTRGLSRAARRLVFLRFQPRCRRTTSLPLPMSFTEPSCSHVYI